MGLRFTFTAPTSTQTSDKLEKFEGIAHRTQTVRNVLASVRFIY